MSPLTAAGDGVRAALARTADADRRLRTLLKPFRPHAEGFAVLATGGYGRGDLSLHSDLDLVLIHDGEDAPHDAVRALVQGLWDQGMHPGQTLLGLGEVDPDLFAIRDRASSLLETRYVWGDRGLADRFEKRVNDLFDESLWTRFYQLKEEEFLARRIKFGTVPRVVEPHLKQQTGGLRDMHHVLWLEEARTALAGRWRLRRRRDSEVRAFIGRLKHAKLLEGGEAKQLFQAYDLLLRLREALREGKDNEEDLLHVPEQTRVGQALGFSGGERMVMREVMRAAFQAFEKISRFADEFGTLLTEYGMGRPDDVRPVQFLPGATLSRGRIDLSRKALRSATRTPVCLLKLLDYAVRSETPLSGRARHALRRELHPVPGYEHEPREWAEPLRNWLEMNAGFARRLRSLDELDAIGLWLPEWREIAGLTTGSYYHTYTVDEHTLRALERLDHLPDDGPEGLPASLWKSFPHRPVLYLALIFHDIAKGRRGDHSLEGALIASAALSRLGWEEWIRPVAKLIRLHLRMEQVAFRRDSKEPAVISSFAAEVGDLATLDALYLLTVCDLSAVSKRVWTTWKGHLLAELYLETRDWFLRGERAAEFTVAQEVERVAPLIGGGAEAEDRARSFIASMREEYRRAVPAAEIAKHVHATEELAKGEPFRWLIEERNGYLVLTVITWDRVGLLARVAGLLVTQGIGIREARIFTREDGVVLDRFRAEDTEPNGVPLDERLARIEPLWRELNEEKLTLDELIDRFRRRRRLDHNPAALVEAEVTVTPSSGGYLVDVSGPDSIGLLYRLCSVFAEEGIDVRAARVSRRIDGIMDAFLVHDPLNRLATPGDRLALIQRLREAVDATV